MAEKRSASEEELLAEGWTRQFNTDEPRLTEAVEMYQEMGLEVHLEPVVIDPQSSECQMCMEQDCERYKVIWTRPSGRPREDDELF